MQNETYDRLKNVIENSLETYLPIVDERSRVLGEAMLYSLKAGGKRIRPVLLLAVCEICGGKVTDALPYACALEFIHTYSLIHDDHPSMDNDDLRRGKPTNHKVFGDDMAILAGDGLLNSAFDIMMKDLVSDFSMTKLNAAAEISKAAGVKGMIAGQTADVRMSDVRGTLSDVELLKYIHRNKTGALIRASVMAGAILGGADEKKLEIFDTYAQKLGLVFQIVDDILDVTGDEKNLGKKIGTDAELGKLTYPSVFGLEKSFQLAEQYTAEAVETVSSIGNQAEFLVKMAIDLQKRIS